MPTLTYLEAIRQGILEEMERNPTVFCLGEDIGIYGVLEIRRSLFAIRSGSNSLLL